MKAITQAKSMVTELFCQTDKRIKLEFSLLLILSILVLMTVTWKEVTHNQMTGHVETASMAYLDDTLQKAGAAFLIARALNATLSVMQSFTITPFIGELSLGEVLDPINDLVERFSWIMLAVTVSVGIQQLLMEIGISVDLSWLILPALIFLLISLFIKKDQSKYLLRIVAYKLLLFTLLIRFAIPVTGFIGANISTAFLAEKREAAIESLEKAKEKISEISVQEAAKSPKKTVEKVQKDSQEIIEQVIKLITLFVFETLLFPILVLWGLIKLFGAIFYWPVSRVKTS